MIYAPFYCSINEVKLFTIRIILMIQTLTITPAANRLFGPEMPLSCVDLNVPRKVSLTCRIAHSANQRTVDDRFQNNHLLLHMTSTSCQSGEICLAFENVKIKFQSKLLLAQMDTDRDPSQQNFGFAFCCCLHAGFSTIYGPSMPTNYKAIHILDKK